MQISFLAEGFFALFDINASFLAVPQQLKK
jgi:hypothetical protein